MKKSLYLLTLLLAVNLFNSVNVQAQTERKNLFKVNFLSPLVRTASLFYERVVGTSTSVQLGFFYTGASVGSDADKTTIRGFGITPEFRYYLSDKGAPQGFFLAPYLRYQNFELTTNVNGSDEKAKLSGFGGGLVVGGQWLFKDRISLEVFGGPGFSGRNIKYEGSATEDDFNFTGLGSFTFRLGATLGIAF